MVDVTSLRQALDDTGNPYPAVRPRAVQFLGVTTASATPVAAFQPQTKVIRICANTDVFAALVGVSGGGNFLIAAAHYQDLIVQPGDTLTLQAVGTNGNASVAELL